MPVDYKKYPPDWHTRIRPAILARAGHCCEVCKVPNYSIVCRGMWDGVEVWQNDDGAVFRLADGARLGDTYCGDVWGKEQTLVRIVLTVAHLDHDVTNNDPGNLKALCQLHHLRHDVDLHRANSRATNNKKRGLQNLFNDEDDRS